MRGERGRGRRGTRQRDASQRDNFDNNCDNRSIVRRVCLDSMRLEQFRNGKGRERSESRQGKEKKNR